MTQSTWDIHLSNLKVGYGENVVLENIDAILPAGKISIILGGSGCGKSTLLRHIIGLSKPMSGEISVGGVAMHSAPKKECRRIKHRMGVLFQDGALLGSLTVGENVGLSLKEHTRLTPKMIREVSLGKLSLVGLADFIDYYPSELSGGMRKRAGLARALATNPSILLCDEPTSGLDPLSAAQMDQLLLSLKDHFPEMTIVAVSHDLSSLRAIADYVLVLNQKKNIFTGTLAELEASKDPYIVQFLSRTTTDSGEINSQKIFIPSPETLSAYEQEVKNWFNQ